MKPYLFFVILCTSVLASADQYTGYGAPITVNPYVTQGGAYVQLPEVYLVPREEVYLVPRGAENYNIPQAPQAYPVYNGQVAVPQPQHYDDPARWGALCSVDYAPHSYACHHWNYLGNSMFPLFTLDWHSTLQGEWFATTYANPTSENIGPEFIMLKNPHRPTQPDGVLDNYSGSLVESVWVNGNTLYWTNWRGAVFQTDPNTFRILDNYTVEMYGYFGAQLHYFQCRDFNRNDSHHLLCRWDTQNSDGSFTSRGYFGFMPKYLWDQFKSRQH